VNIEKLRKVQCFQSGCHYAETRCLSYRGNDCIKNGGSRIPLQQVGDREYPTQSPVGMKPRFIRIEDGWLLDGEGR